jgi:L-2,4-diaminobutyric acid acetyltransferase
LRNSDEIEIHPPVSTDGYELNRLVERSPPLDSNSIYCNILQCNHFKDTSVCARRNGKIVGFVSGYLIPARPDTLFVWQVVVAEEARGQGLAGRMLQTLLAQPACHEATHVETTITPDNEASHRVFRKLAQQNEADLKITPGFDRERHFNGEHESEELWRIGPLAHNPMRLLV